MTLRGRAVALIIPVIEFPGPVGALPITSVVNAAPSGPYWDRTANRGTSTLLRLDSTGTVLPTEEQATCVFSSLS